MNIKSNNTDVITSILTMAKEILVQTPEAQFNAGAYDAEIEWLSKLNDIDVANAYLANEANKTALADAKTKAIIGTADDMKNYGYLQRMAGLALIIKLTGGKITKQAFSQNIPLCNLLAQAYLKAPLEDLRKEFDFEKEPVPGETTAYGLWKLLKDGVSAGDAIGSIQHKFNHPALTIGDDNSTEYLSLAGRIWLGLLKAELKPALAEQFKQAGQQNAELFAAILRAG